MWPWGKKTIAERTVKLPLNELRKRARILVVDDDPSAFPHKLLAKEGYNVTYWKSIDNIRELETGEYDIIVLDIHGITPSSVSSTEGLGILTHIKKYNPAQIVIAYSGHKYDLKHSEFWNIADDYLGKPSSLLDCKEKIDSLLEEKFTPNYYAGVLKKILREHGVSEKQIAKLENYVVKTTETGTTPSDDSIMKITGITKNVAGIVAAIVSVIVRLLHHAAG
jgi:DNA-binding response OmpR family regulator